MDEQPTEIRSDGTPVFGPPLPDYSKEKSSGFGVGLVIAGVFCLLFAFAGFLGGRATAPRPQWQTLYGQRIQEGCLPQVLVVGIGKLGEMDKLNDAADYAASGIHHTYADAKYIEKHVVTVTGALKQKNPAAEVVAYLTLERCLG